jgi:hypothetical protein
MAINIETQHISTLTMTTSKIAQASKHVSHCVGMDQLYYFLELTRDFLEHAQDEDKAFFWACIEKYCPDLMQAIRASFQGEWSNLFFTRTLHTPTFNWHEALLRSRELAIQEYVDAFHTTYEDEISGDIG